VEGPQSNRADAELGRARTGVNIAGGWFLASETFATSRPFSLTTTGGVEPFIQVDDMKTLTLNGIVGGDALHKDGDGMLVLNGANTYSKTFIEQGQVAGNSTSIRGDIAFQRRGALPSLRFDQAATGMFRGNLSGDGALIKMAEGPRPEPCRRPFVRGYAMTHNPATSVVRDSVRGLLRMRRGRATP